MFCNEIEDTLFSPLPPSLVTDYYKDDQETSDNSSFFGNRGMRNYHSSSSNGRQRLLPSLRHFRSLPRSRRGSGDHGSSDDDDDSGDFSDEFGTGAAGFSCSSPPSSPIPRYSSSSSSSQEVKSMFHQDGCLFAYSPPSSSSSDSNSSFRARMRRAKGSLSPRSRRNNRTSCEPSLSQYPSPEQNSSLAQFRKNSHRFRY